MGTTPNKPLLIIFCRLFFQQYYKLTIGMTFLLTLTVTKISKSKRSGVRCTSLRWHGACAASYFHVRGREFVPRAVLIGTSRPEVVARCSGLHRDDDTTYFYQIAKIDYVFQVYDRVTFSMLK